MNPRQTTCVDRAERVKRTATSIFMNSIFFSGHFKQNKKKRKIESHRMSATAPALEFHKEEEEKAEKMKNKTKHVRSFVRACCSKALNRSLHFLFVVRTLMRREAQRIHSFQFLYLFKAPAYSLACVFRSFFIFSGCECVVRRTPYAYCALRFQWLNVKRILWVVWCVCVCVCDEGIHMDTKCFTRSTHLAEWIREEIPISSDL